jgi:hypothetical protein
MGILKDITFLELFPVVVALCIWGEQLKNKKIISNESISVVKVSRDGLVFRCLVGLPLDKGSGNAANHNEITNQQFYLIEIFSLNNHT